MAPESRLGSHTTDAQMVTPIEGINEPGVSGRVSSAVANTQAKSNLGRKGLISSYSSQVTFHHWGKVRVGACKQELKQKPCHGSVQFQGGTLSTGFLSMASSACFLRQLRTACPGMAPPTVIWALQHQLLIEKMSYGFAYWPILQWHFLG